MADSISVEADESIADTISPIELKGLLRAVTAQFGKAGLPSNFRHSVSSIALIPDAALAL